MYKVKVYVSCGIGHSPKARFLATLSYSDSYGVACDRLAQSILPASEAFQSDRRYVECPLLGYSIYDSINDVTYAYIIEV